MGDVLFSTSHCPIWACRGTFKPLSFSRPPLDQIVGSVRVLADRLHQICEELRAVPFLAWDGHLGLDARPIERLEEVILSLLHR